MIIVKLMGGLGNQLFQYATGRAVALRKQVSLKLDLSWFDANSDATKRSFRLYHFNIDFSAASASDIAEITGINRNDLLQPMYRLQQRLRPYYRRSVFLERYFHYDPNIFRCEKTVHLIGYWQSFRYFEDIEGAIRNEFQISTDISPSTRSCLDEICGLNSISVHARRGDYVSNASYRKIHSALPVAYYESAVQKIAQVVKDPSFFVFSDDIAWAKDNLNFGYPTRFVEHNNELNDHEDLLLMMSCKNHVIANSTFSWWGAWLASNQNKVVVAPRTWFGTTERNPKDLLPKDWMLVS